MSRIAKSEVEVPRRSARLVVLGYGVLVAAGLGGLLALVALLT